MRTLRPMLLAWFVLSSLALAIQPTAAAAPPESGDFNGDGYADIAIGVPYEGVGTKDRAGAVNVIYGGAAGLSSAGAQVWNQDSPNVPGTAGVYDYCGISVATGDFNGDGYGDLAFGCLFENVSGVVGAGAVIVLPGSASGLTGVGSQRLSQDTAAVPDNPEYLDGFGFSLAAGDVNGDGMSDLAVGAIYENQSGTDTGSITVLRGSAGGLTGTGSQRFVQGDANTWGQPHDDDELGWSLAAGDVNNDGYADLVAGTPFDDVSGIVDAGSAQFFFGSPTVVGAGTRIPTPTSTNRFAGWDVAVGDFSGDSNADVAIAEPGAKAGVVKKAGQVRVAYGPAPGSGTVETWNLASPDVVGDPQPSTYLGSALAAGDMNGDGIADLAAAASDTVSGKDNAGAVYVLYGGSGALTGVGSQVWTQDSPGVLDKAETDDFVGWELAIADFGGSAESDLAITVPQEDVAGIGSGGVVQVLYGSAGTGVTATSNQLWSQDSPGIPDKMEAGDQFGYVVV